MTTLFATARALHYASALLLLGELMCVVWIAAAPGRRAHVDAGGRFFVVAGACVVALASGIAWFVAEAAVMSDRSVVAAMNRDTLALVLSATGFGRLWMLRAALLAAVSLLLVALSRAPVGTRRSMLAIAALATSAAYLATLAWAGHAVAAQGSEDDVELAADVVHLIAAGAWLGALPGFVHLLGRVLPDDVARSAARHFSWLGLICVAALIASGLVNAWYQVGGIPALVGTDYGRWLLAKLAVFALILAIATVNRGYLVPRLTADDRGARRSLRRNAMLEVALGILVVCVVGKLGVTVPAVHQPPAWPFAYTLSWQAMEQSAWLQVALAAAGAIALFASIVSAKLALDRPPRISIVALACIAAPAGLFAWFLGVPARPTTYVTSPVDYDTRAVADGAARYALECSGCHGRDGRGERNAAHPTIIDLTQRVPERREGDLFWSIRHGIPGTPMPGLAPGSSDVAAWNLVQFLDAQWSARNALAMTDRLKPLLPIAAPDFTYELAGRPQESLKALRDKRVTLLVFYTVPQSLPRLVELAAKHRAYAAAGARVIAVPIDPASTVVPADGVPAGESMLARAGADVAKAYALFAPQEGATEPVPTHVEYLLDRDFYLRVRWTGIPESGEARTPAMLDQIDRLYKEPPRAAPQWGHRH